MQLAIALLSLFSTAPEAPPVCADCRPSNGARMGVDIMISRTPARYLHIAPQSYCRRDSVGLLCICLRIDVHPRLAIGLPQPFAKLTFGSMQHHVLIRVIFRQGQGPDAALQTPTMLGNIT